MDLNYKHFNILQKEGALRAAASNHVPPSNFFNIFSLSSFQRKHMNHKFDVNWNQHLSLPLVTLAVLTSHEEILYIGMFTTKWFQSQN